MYLKIVFLFELVFFINCLTNSDHRRILRDELNSKHLWNPLMTDVDYYTDTIDKNTALLKVFSFSFLFLADHKDFAEFKTESKFTLKDIYFGEHNKWCGSGNRTTGDDDVGLWSQTDTCCMKHDKCPLSIDPGETFVTTKEVVDPRTGVKYERKYENTASYTVSLCQCDAEFFQCLKDVIHNTTNFANRIWPRTIGSIYFTLLTTRCIYTNEGEPPKVKEYKNSFFKDKFNITLPSNVEKERPTQCDLHEPANCTTPLTGEYREIMPHCALLMSSVINGKQTVKCWINKEKFMKLRVCSHLLGTHCAVCKTGCTCKYLTKGLEPNMNIYFLDV